MHLNGFGKTDGLSHQAFDPCTQCGMLAFDLLHILFPNRVFIYIEMATICTPSIGIKACDTQRR